MALRGSGRGSGGLPTTAEGSFVLFYMGASVLDTRIVYTSSMMSWIVSEILRFTTNDMVVLRLKDYKVSVEACGSFGPLFDCHVWEIVKFFQVDLTSCPDDPRHFFGILVRTSQMYYHCRLFSSTSEAQVSGIMTTMTEAGNKCPASAGPVVRSNSSPKMSDSASESISFEVLYIGKLRMSYRKAPVTFIDDALDKFKSYESERGSRESNATTNSNDSRRSSSQESGSEQSPNAGLQRVAALLQNIERDADEADRKIQSNPTINIQNRSEKEDRVVPKASFPHPLEDITYSNGKRNRNPSGDTCLLKSLSLPVEPLRARALSTGHEPRVLEKSGSSDSNRTMILIIGKQEIRIIRPDTQFVVLIKSYRELTQTAKGIQNKECFGFIVKDAGATGTTYLGYIFRCESEAISEEILQVLRQASSSSGNPTKKEAQLLCDHCPMMWYHKLCSEIEGLSHERTNALILRRIDGLAEDDRTSIMAKFQGAQTVTFEEENELMMMLLRAHCESKQLKHTHDTAENRHEFLQSTLGGGTILMKARRSISSSFDQLIKRKEQRLKDYRDLNTILPHHVIHQGKEMSPSAGEPTTASKFLSDMRVSESPVQQQQQQQNFRPRSSTLGSASGDTVRSEVRSRRGSQANAQAHHSVPDPSRTHSYSPMMNIFLKVGSSKAPESGSVPGPRRPPNWRQAIFKRVVSPSPSPERGRGLPGGARLVPAPLPTLYRPQKGPADYRELWKSAIRQQIILNRMEKQNYILRAQQEETNVKRNKLSYRELGICLGSAGTAWESVIAMAKDGQLVPAAVLKNALVNGIPKQMRGTVWKVLIQQSNVRSRSRVTDSKNTSYDQLLRQLTSHQHAILIDLGRTFPNHPYFSSPLRAGQLALFNILKAYSLLDPEVGYCQGLSFVAGILLMHLDEEDAFEVLKHVMFNLDGRVQYKPDMCGLQLKLYQLNRLIYDQDAEVHLLLYHNEVLPSLYAAPWLLTMFASQFSIGFAARVMDLVLLCGVDVLIKLAMVVIQDFKTQLMECRGLEQIMECFKTTVTQVSSAQMDSYLTKILGLELPAPDPPICPISKLRMDWDTSLATYAIEYNVMTDETFLEYLSSSSRRKKGSAPDPRVSEEELGRLREERDSLQAQVRLLLNYVGQCEAVLARQDLRSPRRPEGLPALLEPPPAGRLNGNGPAPESRKKKLILPDPSDYLSSIPSAGSPPPRPLPPSDPTPYLSLSSSDSSEDGLRSRSHHHRLNRAEF